MTLRERIILLKNDGLTIKLISKKTGINESTLYGFTSGKRELSPEKIEKIITFIDTLFPEKREE